MNAFGVPVIEEAEIKTNDIYAALMSYGVEMARALILKEIRGVFGAYNIDVDIRHLELIADYMVSLYKSLLAFPALTRNLRLTTADTSLSTAKVYQQTHLLY